MLRLRSYAAGRWVTPDAGLAAILSAIDSRPVAETSSAGLDFAAMVSHARAVAGPRLRALTFQDRAAILKELALYLTDRKAPLYELAHETGATRRDSLGDIDGGIGVLFAYAARGRRELPDQRFVLDGAVEPLSKRGGFVGQHILSPLEGVAVHINAFNFPCWGLLEKFAPAFLAGVPVIAKPATVTAYLAEALVRLMIESQLLPEGSLQFIAGNAGDLLDHLTGQDLVAVTGSLETSLALRNHPAIARHAVRFTAERDSLNAAVLGPDARPGTAEFDHFMAEVVGEVTAKAGQKCTAIRRIIVPRAFEAEVIAAFGAKCEALTVGDPRRADVDIGPLVSLAQRDEVRARIALMAREAEIVVAEALLPEAPAGGYMSPVLLRARDPLTSRCIHTIEAFGPVATVMGYDTIDQAIDLVRRGEGSLVATLCSADDTIAAALVAGLAPYHGRLHILDGESAAESTGQ